MLYKGTVIEIHGNRAFVLNSSCEYQEVMVTGNVQPGDEIEYFRKDIYTTQRQFPSVKKLAVIAASFVLFFLVSFTAYQQIAVRSVYVYLALDINPSLEIGINKDYKIVKATGFNNEGQSLIDKNSFLKTNLDLALSEIIQKCSSEGYLSSGQINYIGISLYFPGAGDSKALLVQLEKQITKSLELNDLNAEVYYLSIDKKTHEEALRNNVSPTKYLLWERSKENGLNFSQASEISLKDPRINQIASQIATQVSHGLKGESKGSPSNTTEDQPSISNNSSPNSKPVYSDAGRNKTIEEAPAGEAQNQAIPIIPENPKPDPGNSSPADSINPGDQQGQLQENTPMGGNGSNGSAHNETQSPIKVETGKSNEQKNTPSTGGLGKRK